jgi:hypothetical protein
MSTSLGRCLKNRIDASGDLSKLLGNPILEGCSFHHRSQIHKTVRNHTG